ncbi:MAG: DUF4395 domain-containing protein [Cellulomonadaceae bacterium]
MRSFFSFPNPVNEVASRVVAGVVTLLAVITLATQWAPLLLVLAYGFVARVLAGPRLSPLGLLAQRVVAPRLATPRPVPGPPKRFAQGIGAVLTVSAAVAFYGFDAPVVAWSLVGALAVAASLESVLGFCLGCWIFGHLQRWGIIPASVCEACNDIRLRRPAPSA